MRTRALREAVRAVCGKCAERELPLGIKRWTLERRGEIYVHVGFNDAGVACSTADCPASKIHKLLEEGH
jgi:hypothetical protein